MAKSGPQTTRKHSTEFKLKAVYMSNDPDVLVKDVAESLCIHPFMLSRWRKEFRDGILTGEVERVATESVAELKRLRDLERQHKRLQLEHELLKKAIRFASDLKRQSSLSLKQTGKPSRSK
jgi:transposase